MSDAVRDPDQAFSCPRCGSPVRYKGRGRRPVWCSARCRTEASIERRGNRIVGVEPRVVTILPPAQRLTEWEQNQRRRIQQTLAEDTVTDLVANDPNLLVRVLEGVQENLDQGSGVSRPALAQALRRIAASVDPEGAPDQASAHGSGAKRSAAEWSGLLDQLATELADGRFYRRDLPAIEQPLNRVAELFLRRRTG